RHRVKHAVRACGQHESEVLQLALRRVERALARIEDHKAGRDGDQREQTAAEDGPGCDQPTSARHRALARTMRRGGAITLRERVPARHLEHFWASPVAASYSRKRGGDVRKAG